MNTKFTVILISLCLVSVLLASWCFHNWMDERKNRQRTESNLVLISNEYKQFKDTSFARIGVLSMEVSEVKKAFPELENSLKKEFGVKLKDIIQLTNTQATVNNTFKTFIRDSVRIDSIMMKAVNYTDSFFRFRATEYKNVLTVLLNEVRVPLIQVTSREPWKIKYLLPWHWGDVRPLVQDIKSTNPHAIIEYSRTIKVIHR